MSRRAARIAQLQKLMKPVTQTDALGDLVNITNRKLRALKTQGELGTYASKTLINRARLSADLYYDKKSNQIRISNRDMNFGQKRLATKQLKSFIGSKTSDVRKLRDVRTATQSKVQKELQNISGKNVTKKDVDKFYKLSKFASKQLESQIDPSDLYALIEDAKENNYNQDYFIQILSNYVDLKDESMRLAAEDLYNKYVRG